MQIGELAAETGATVRLIRHYEAQGLIHSSRRANGYRDYDVKTVKHIERIRVLLDCGFSTKQIQSFLPCFDLEEDFNPETCAAGFRQHLVKLRELDSMIELLSERRRRLSERIAKFGRTIVPDGNEESTTQGAEPAGPAPHRLIVRRT